MPFVLTAVDGQRGLGHEEGPVGAAPHDGIGAPGRDSGNPACPPCALRNGRERSTAVNPGM
jgi:hypothetical protein